MGLLSRVEEVLSIPGELFHRKNGFHPVDLNRMALQCMERGCRRGIHKVYAPNRFILKLSAPDYEDLAPFLDIIRSDIAGELRRVVSERDYLLAGALTVEILRSDNCEKGRPRVFGFMQADREQENPDIAEGPKEESERTGSLLENQAPENPISACPEPRDAATLVDDDAPHPKAANANVKRIEWIRSRPNPSASGPSPNPPWTVLEIRDFTLYLRFGPETIDIKSMDERFPITIENRSVLSASLLYGSRFRVGDMEMAVCKGFQRASEKSAIEKRRKIS